MLLRSEPLPYLEGVQTYYDSKKKVLRKGLLREGEEFLAEVLQGGADMIDIIIHDQETVVDVFVVADT